MDQGNTTEMSKGATSLGEKSWTAYIGVVFLGLALLLLATPLAWSSSAIAGAVMLIVSVILIAFQILKVKSYRLYCDEAGVWVFSGVLPWNKGVSGVKWRDLDEAVFFKSMGSWLFKSYSIRIGHRFTKSSEIILTHWAHGHHAVEAINNQHQQMVRTGSLG